MDYPHPFLKFNGDQMDFSEAYDTGIGRWDKVSVAYSYTDFSEGTDEKQALNAILEQAKQDGLRFISDYDARAAGGAHAYAHLWDNGSSPSEELRRVLKVREQAIANFSADNIRSGEPYSVLEDVFVPLYFFHRYQTEAATKLIGGLEYNYAVKGDGQVVTKPVASSVQGEALKAVLETLNSENLAIPKDKLSLFPPRAFNYPRTRESFNSSNGVAFDPLSAAATASDFSLGFLLHPERMNRLIQQSALNASALSLNAVLDKLIGSTFGTRHADAYLNAVQQAVNERVLLHIMNLAQSDKASFATKAHTLKALDVLNNMLKDDVYGNYYKRMIADFKKNPKAFELEQAPRIPDGSPIGSDCNFFNE